MAAAIKALNSRIRANPIADYVCSTHFWGPVSNFGIPIAAVMDTQKSPEMISGPMTGTLVVYAMVFMRYSLAVTPKNYLLFACHAVNFCAQSTQSYRYLNYWHMGGREKIGVTTSTNEVQSIKEAAKDGLKQAEQKVADVKTAIQK